MAAQTTNYFLIIFMLAQIRSNGAVYGSIQFSLRENHSQPSRLRPLDYDPAPRFN